MLDIAHLVVEACEVKTVQNVVQIDTAKVFIPLLPSEYIAPRLVHYLPSCIILSGLAAITSAVLDMRLVRPGWLRHLDDTLHSFEIYSLDVDPSGTRMATGGLDGKARIWPVSATALAGTDEEPEDPQLFALASHNGAVTCVKFSPDGRYLATGSDDRIVLVSERVNQETWSARKRLVGHDSDVQDLAWSPDQSLIVSVGLDSAVIVWSATTFEKIKRLDYHTSHVKGIAFDPAGKYFVTCSDDRTARFVRYFRPTPTEFSFSVEAVVETPFREAPLTTYFRRCSWSPDGESIAAPNATNGSVPTVAIIDRGKWSTSEDCLVGHQAACEVCRFSPRLYKLGKAGVVGSVLATASQDGTLVLWSTNDARPLCVVQNVCTKAISDLAWDPSGLVVFASSLDGTVLRCEFGPNDIGTVLSPEETRERLSKYGQAEFMDIPESVEQVQMENKKEDSADGKKNPTASNSLPSSTNTEPQSQPQIQSSSSNVSNTLSQAQPVSMPQVRRTKDGRKRVTPVLVGADTPAAPSVSTTPAPAIQHSSAEFDRPSNGLPKGGVPSLVIGHKRRAEDAPKPPKRPEWTKPAVVSPAVTASALRLATPKVISQLSTDVDAKAVLEARNGRQGDPTKVTVVRDGKLVFTDFIAEHAHLATGAPDWFWSVSSDDGVVYIWTPQGQRWTPPFALGAALSFLESRERWLVAVTSTGMVYAWNVQEHKALFPPVSLAPILDTGSKAQELTKGPGVTSVQVTGSSVVVSLTNGNVYAYYAEMQAWSRVSEPFWAYGSQFWDSTGFAVREGPVAAAERRTNEEALLKAGARGRAMQRQAVNRMLQEGFQRYDEIVSLSHLANRVASSSLLDVSGSELKRNLELYIRRLSEFGQRSRLDEVFRALLANNRPLLAEMIEVARNYRSVQTLVVEYLGALNGS